MMTFSSDLICLFLLLINSNIYYTFQLDKINDKTQQFRIRTTEIINYVNKIANSSWKAGHTDRFQTIDEVKFTLGALKNEKSAPLLMDTRLPSYRIPQHFDSREEWPYCPSISLIRDQSSCGSCWAFGAVEAISDRICIHSYGNQKVNISAEDLLSCCKDCGYGCKGGSVYSAWKYWVEEGIVTGDGYHTNSGCRDYYFPKCDHHINGSHGPCKELQPTPPCVKLCRTGYPYSYEDDKYYGDRFYGVDCSELAIRSEILQNGPVEASFQVYEDFVTYKSGVYRHLIGTYVGGHAIRILGWGVEKGTNYWLAANSWNDGWGDHGYFKILRGSNECEIEQGVTAGIPRKY